MQELDNIVVVCVCDNHFAMLLAALIKSIESNHHTSEKVEFFIIEDNISEKNKLKIDNFINPATTIIRWIAMEDALPENAKLPVDNTSHPANVYTRIFIPYFIPETVKRVIFMDVDMIMLEDISKLWYLQIENNIVAAVQDQFIQIVSRWGGVANYEELGISAENKYFNSGLMLIDLEKWKEADITNKVLNCLSKYKEHILYQDQYGLNAVLAQQWYSLDPLWNRFAYSEEERPFLIHFTGRKPIYNSYEFSEKYKEIFYSYLRMTGWKNFKPISETSRYFKKFNNVLDKFKKLITK